MIIPHIVQTLPTSTECKQLSINKGVVYTNPYAVSHVQGRVTEVYIQMDEFPTIQLARETVCELTNYDIKDVKYTYSSMARQVSEWLGVKQRYNDLPPKTLIPHWHYQQAIPTYQSGMYLHDMRSAYWQIASKAKSLLCSINPRTYKVLWNVMSNEQEEKWHNTKLLLEPCKKLRLSIIGVNSTEWSTKNTNMYYVKGELKPVAGKPPTCFQSLALLTVRCAYELTQLQAIESDCWYANADCVATHIKQLTLWRDMGIVYRTKAQGECEIRGVGAWKIGGDHTIPYELMLQRNILSRVDGINLPDPYFNENIFH